jgi:hypothetical protein
VNLASADSVPWTLAAERSPTLEIVCFKQTVVLAWNQFLFAEGSDDWLRIAFATHEIAIEGCGLRPLVEAVTAQRVASIRQSSRRDAFGNPSASLIREIEVRRFDAA